MSYKFINNFDSVLLATSALIASFCTNKSIVTLGIEIIDDLPLSVQMEAPGGMCLF